MIHSLGNAGAWVFRRGKIGIGLAVCISLAEAVPERAVIDSTRGSGDPPAGTIIAVYVAADSGDSLPLSGAKVIARNGRAEVRTVYSDTQGWAYFAPGDLLPGSYSDNFWITAGHTGYVSKKLPDTTCPNRPMCTVKLYLEKATGLNSITFTGTLLDSARRPLPGLLANVGIGNTGGYMSVTGLTDSAGGFVLTGIPKGSREGFLFVQEYQVQMGFSLASPGQVFIASRRYPVGIVPALPHRAPFGRMRASPRLLFQSSRRDAAGRHRH